MLQNSPEDTCTCTCLYKVPGIQPPKLFFFVNFGKFFKATYFADISKRRILSSWISIVADQLLTVTEIMCTLWKASVFGVFLVRIFPHSDWIGRNTEYLSVFSPNAGKYRSEKLQIRILFTKCGSWKISEKYLLFKFCIKFKWTSMK